jgi:hypothetical protein
VGQDVRKGRDAKDMASFCDLDTVLSGAEDDLPSSKSPDTGGTPTFTRAGTTTVDGAKAVVVHAKDAKESYTMYVATEGKPYVLRLDSTSPDDPGSITFTDYNEPVPAQKPAGHVVDLDALGA